MSCKAGVWPVDHAPAGTCGRWGAFLKAFVRSDKEPRGKDSVHPEKGCSFRTGGGRAWRCEPKEPRIKRREGHSFVAFVTGRGQFTRPDFGVDPQGGHQ